MTGVREPRRERQPRQVRGAQAVHQHDRRPVAPEVGVAHRPAEVERSQPHHAVSTLRDDVAQGRAFARVERDEDGVVVEHTLAQRVAAAAALGGQGDGLHAPVVGVRLAGGQAGLLQPVDDPGHVRRVAEQVRRQVAHRDRRVEVLQRGGLRRWSARAPDAQRSKCARIRAPRACSSSCSSRVTGSVVASVSASVIIVESHDSRSPQRLTTSTTRLRCRLWLSP